MPLATMDALELKRFAPGYQEMLRHPSYDNFWETFDIEAKHDRFQARHTISPLYDTLLTGTLRNYVGLRKHAANGPRAVINAW